MNSLYLVHHGIKGMKWGVRRYQNEDGTLTDVGRRRSKGETDSDKQHSKIRGEVSKDYRNVSKIQNEGANIVRNVKNISSDKRRREREKIKSGIDVSKMSNKELQDAITRMNLERSYKSLKAENIESGKRHVSDYLDSVGSLLALGASAASIAATIYEIKK